jgi:creatinine amidohydrolase
MKWQHLRSDEIAARDKRRAVLLPIGAMEQHGPHLPLCTDATLAEAIADAADAKHDGQLLVLPTMWLGCSQHHMNHAGSLSAQLDTFVDVLTQIGTGVLRHGFENLLLLNAHGGNASALGIAIERISREKPGPLVVGVSWFDFADEQMWKLRRTLIGGAGHAGEVETSMMLHLAPDLVDMDRAAAGGRQPESSFGKIDLFGGGGVASVYRPFEQLSDNGVFGDPNAADADNGRQWIDLAAAGVASLVSDMEAGKL